MPEGEDFVEEFVLNLDAVLRVGGKITNNGVEIENDNKIHAALLNFEIRKGFGRIILQDFHCLRELREEEFH